MVGLHHTPPPKGLLRYNRRSTIPVGAPQSGLALLCLDWYCHISFTASYCLFCSHSTSMMVVPQSPLRSRLGVPLFHSRLSVSLPVWRCSACIGCSAGYVFLNPHQCFLASICTPRFHSALLRHHQYSPCPPSTPQHALLLSLWHFSFPPEVIILSFKAIFIQCEQTSIPTF
jgi:hypothetical protein